MWYDSFLGAEGVTLQLKVSPTEQMSLKLESPPEPSRKPSVLFIGALVKVKINSLFLKPHKVI